MTCIPIPNGFLCVANVTIGDARDSTGRLWRWEFDPRFGPLFVDRRGEPLKHQPEPRLNAKGIPTNKGWQLFSAWHKQTNGNR